MATTTAHLDLLRHGDTGRRGFRGQRDDALTEKGWAQMRAAVAAQQWDAIVTSPLQRCAGFAQELALQRNLPLHAEPRLAEYHFGTWQDLDLDTLAQAHGEALGRFWADPVAHPPPGAETFAAFETRLRAACAAIASEWSGRRVLVVTHGGAIRLLRCRAEGRALREMASLEVPHASLHRLPWPLPLDIDDVAGEVPCAAC